MILNRHLRKMLLFFLFPLAMCSNRPHFKRSELQIANNTVQVELAITTSQRALGLMHRKHLDEDAGMLFIFERDQLLNFYMKDTLIPLSIAFIDRYGIIREIYPMKPESLELVSSRWPVRYALEMNQGWFKKNNTHIGSKIEIESLQFKIKDTDG